jgi:hypothetical protein
MANYYDNTEGVYAYLQEAKELHPNKSVTEIISLACDVPVPFFTDNELEDLLKLHILQNT